MVVPPITLRSRPSHSASLSLGGRVSSPTSRSGSSIIPLKSTLSEQLWAIARSYGFPSIVGISLHLDVLHASQMGFGQEDFLGRSNKAAHRADFLDWYFQDPSAALPCITEESWQILFERESLPTNLLQCTGFPIAGRVEFEIDLSKAYWYDAWSNATLAPLPSRRPPLRLSLSSYTGSDRSFASKPFNSYYGCPSSRSSVISEGPLSSCYSSSVSDGQNGVSYAPRGRVRQRSIYLLSQERQYSRPNHLASSSRIKANLRHGLLSAHEEDPEAPSMVDINVTAVPQEDKENFTASVLDLVEESFRSIAEEADPEVAFNRAQLFVAARQGGPVRGDSYDQLISSVPDHEELSDSYQHSSPSNLKIQHASYNQAISQCTTYESDYCSDLLADCVDITLPKTEKVQPVVGPKTKSFEEMSKSMRRARRKAIVAPTPVARRKDSLPSKTLSPPPQPSLQYPENRKSYGGDEALFDSLAGILEELKSSPKQTKSDSRASKGLPRVKCDDDDDDDAGSDHVDCYDGEDSDLELDDSSVIQSARKVPIETFSGRILTCRNFES